MGGEATPPELDVALDIFGQRLVTIFTQISFCFQTPDASATQNALETLRRGMQRLAVHFPWVAGQVVCENASPHSSGIYKMKALHDTPRLSIKDLSNDTSMPSMNELRRSGFPMRCLDEELVAPRKSNSGGPREKIAEVFQVQATIINDGLILTFLGQHQSMDGVGQNQVINLLAKACAGEAFTAEELRIGNMAREEIVPLLGPSWSPSRELEHNIIKMDPQEAGPGSMRSKMPDDKGVWCHFGMSRGALQALKEQATSTMPPTTKFVSTDDAITAFVWQSITRVRYSSFDPATKTFLGRAVDLRRYLAIPQEYPGFIQSMAYNEFTMEQLLNSPLGVISAALRAEVDTESSSMAYHAQSFATLISRTADKTRTSYIGGFDMLRDVMISSWSNQNSYDLDFGFGLGTPEAVRRPKFDGFQGLAYLMPRDRNGDIGVAICLDEKDMLKLREDEQFCCYATCIG
ncbi:hypothetical protein NQ176_g4725 [Zarea fungicola]|uniref:Uncharacterized protein n=1 Tax=Zarea fungicola TaxID=93591 RepID=A0ACC1NBY2_9HYPO|nr:hypothetical protein NQ176_g4725 [Lecanicillium fungicola]